MDKSDQEQMMIKKSFGEKVFENKLLIYFVFVLIISWAVWIPMALNNLKIIVFEIPLLLGSTIGAFGPLITLIILEKLTKRRVSADEIFKTIRLRSGPGRRWLIIAAVIFPLLTIGGTLLNFAVGNEANLQVLAPAPLQDLGWWLIGLIPLTFCGMLFSSPLLEEPGWRGFALGQLQEKFGRQLGSIMLGSFWWIWHVPLNIASGLNITIYSYCLMVAHSFLIDSIFNSSQKNLLSAMFAHASIWLTFTYFYSGTDNWYVVGIFIATVVVLRFWEWKKEKSI